LETTDRYTIRPELFISETQNSAWFRGLQFIFPVHGHEHLSWTAFQVQPNFHAALSHKAERNGPNMVGATGASVAGVCIGPDSVTVILRRFAQKDTAAGSTRKSGVAVIDSIWPLERRQSRAVGKDGNGSDLQEMVKSEKNEQALARMRFCSINRHQSIKSARCRTCDD
jgi:hypothetical protein